MNLADVAMVGRLGANALAATGMGAMLVWAVLSFSISFRTATQTVASRRLGQRRYKECGIALHNGHLLALVFGLPLSILGYAFADRIVPLFITDVNVVSKSIDYTAIAALSIFFSSAGFVFQGFFTGVEKTRVHMKVTIVANLLNVYLNAGLIYGQEGLKQFFNSFEGVDLSWLASLWGWYSFPAMGVKGAALATLIASTWMTVHYFLYLFEPEIRKRFEVFSLRLNKEMIFRQIRLALPQGAQGMLVTVGFALFYKIVGMIGTIELAATEVVFTILQTSFMPGAGIGQGCATLVGKYMGEKDLRKAEISIVEGVRWSFWIMGSIGVVFLMVPQFIIPIFTNDPQVIKNGIIGLRLAGLVQFADAFGLTLWFALSGAGNTKFPAVVEAMIMWLFFLPAGYFTGIVLGWGFIGPWVCLGLYILLFASILTWKVAQGDWKEIDL
ncbi:MAG: MATE family efflux transporter [FCB group bacterium]|nr:MATE family efflux transporter [FCB group bacterium]